MAAIKNMVVNVELEAGGKLAKAFEEVREEFKSQTKSITTLDTKVYENKMHIMDAERCIKGQAEELAKTNARMDALVADREKHQRRLDDRLEEVIESTQEAEKAFIIRIERAEKKRDAAYGEIAKLKRAAKGDQE